MRQLARKKGMFMRIVSISTTLVLTLLASLPAPPLAAQAGSPAPAAGQNTPNSAVALASPPVEAGEGKAVASKLADDLVENFVFRDQAEAYAAMVRKNAAAGRYDIGTRNDIAKLMTDDLQAVHKDGHLRVTAADGDQQRPGYIGPAHEQGAVFRERHVGGQLQVAGEPRDGQLQPVSRGESRGRSGPGRFRQKCEMSPRFSPPPTRHALPDAS